MTDVTGEVKPLGEVPIGDRVIVPHAVTRKICFVEYHLTDGFTRILEVRGDGQFTLASSLKVLHLTIGGK